MFVPHLGFPKQSADALSIFLSRAPFNMTLSFLVSLSTEPQTGALPTERRKLHPTSTNRGSKTCTKMAPWQMEPKTKTCVKIGLHKWVWLKMTQEGQTAGFGPCFHFPGQPILVHFDLLTFWFSHFYSVLVKVLQGEPFSFRSFGQLSSMLVPVF